MSAGAEWLRGGQAGGKCLPAHPMAFPAHAGNGIQIQVFKPGQVYSLSPSLLFFLGSVQKKLPLMALSITMAESFKELDTDSSMG